MEKKIDCLLKLFKEGFKTQIIEYLEGTRILNKSKLIGLQSDKDIATVLYLVLKSAEKEEEIVLLSYEWRILPFEYINLTISTQKEHKEFIHED